MSRVEMQAEIRNYVDGSIEVTVNTAYGEPIATLRASKRQGFNEQFAEHEVSYAERAMGKSGEFEGLVTMTGSSSLVRVPLATGEQEEIRRRIKGTS